MNNDKTFEGENEHSINQYTSFFRQSHFNNFKYYKHIRKISSNYKGCKIDQVSAIFKDFFMHMPTSIIIWVCSYHKSFEVDREYFLVKKKYR